MNKPLIFSWALDRCDVRLCLSAGMLFGARPRPQGGFTLGEHHTVDGILIRCSLIQNLFLTTSTSIILGKSLKDMFLDYFGECSEGWGLETVHLGIDPDKTPQILTDILKACLKHFENEC